MPSQKSDINEPPNNEDTEAELVSEFPPPPFYYKLKLTPPLIPLEAIHRSTKKSIAKKKVFEMEERARIGGIDVQRCRDLSGIVPKFPEELNDFDDGPTINVFGNQDYLEVRKNEAWKEFYQKDYFAMRCILPCW